MPILASCDVFPSHLVVTVFDEDVNLIDSVYVSGFWTKNDIDSALKKIADIHNIESWLSPEERKILERKKMRERR